MSFVLMYIKCIVSGDKSDKPSSLGLEIHTYLDEVCDRVGR